MLSSNLKVLKLNTIAPSTAHAQSIWACARNVGFEATNIAIQNPEKNQQINHPRQRQDVAAMEGAVVFSLP